MEEEMKQLFEEQFKKDLANAKEELERAQQNIVEHQFVLDQQVKILEVLEKAKPVILANMKPLNPQFAYEEKDEFVEYLTVAEELKLAQEIFKIKDKSIPGLEKTIKAKEASVKSLTEKIAKLEGDQNE